MSGRHESFSSHASASREWRQPFIYCTIHYSLNAESSAAAFTVSESLQLNNFGSKVSQKRRVVKQMQRPSSDRNKNVSSYIAGPGDRLHLRTERPTSRRDDRETIPRRHEETTAHRAPPTALSLTHRSYDSRLTEYFIYLYQNVTKTRAFIDVIKTRRRSGGGSLVHNSRI